MTPSFHSAHTKLARAREHAKSLADAVRSFHDTRPYKVVTKQDPSSRRLLYLVSIVQPAPPRIPAIIGDVIHNLRAALDHAAYWLVWSATGALPTAHVYFPIGDTRANYVERRTSQLRGASEPSIAAIDALAPYRGGNDQLWTLHKLDIVDKHRVLLTAAAGFRSVDVGSQMIRERQRQFGSMPGWEEILALPAIPMPLRPQHRAFPLKPGDCLYSDAPEAQPDEGLKFHFKLCFHESEIECCEPVIETLTALSDTVSTILSDLERHLVNGPAGAT